VGGKLPPVFDLIGERFVAIDDEWERLGAGI